jgi:hypothetical protein
VSRCLGDGRFKHLGAIAQPDVSACPLRAGEEAFILLACDGVWKTFGVDAAAAIVESALASKVRRGEPLLTDIATHIFGLDITFLYYVISIHAVIELRLLSRLWCEPNMQSTHLSTMPWQQAATITSPPYL